MHPDKPSTHMSRLLRQVPVRRLAFATSPPPKRPRTHQLAEVQSEDLDETEPATLQSYVWNHCQRLSWAIANNLEVSR